MPRVLIVDDERSMREALVRFFRVRHLEVEGAASGAEALAALEGCDLAVCDLQLPDVDGLTVLQEARRRRPGFPVIILTGHASVTLAVEAMRRGAANFLTKPLVVEDLEHAVWAALHRTPSIDGQLITNRSGELFLGESATAEALRQMALRVASSDAPILITGESGTGKEVLARSIHAQSKRAALPFVAVSCGAIPETLIESELFGHEKGAFTGATMSRDGVIAAAGEGTLLLDEIGELAPQVQVKLLRVLQDRAYTPLGATQSQPMRARVMAATNRDLEGLIAKGAFRQDLFYRLNVLAIHVPPLRERGDDVLRLARTFLKRAALAESKGDMILDDDVEICLRNYTWPGNVRELEHAIRQATVLADGGAVTLPDLPVKVRGAYSANRAIRGGGGDLLASVSQFGDAGIDLDATLREVERRIIGEALRRTGGNRNRAAALLKLPRSTLLERLKRHHPHDS